MTDLQACHVCGHVLLALAGYPVAAQVTSDCRPWQGQGLLASCVHCGTVQKSVSPGWLAEMHNLYAGYAVYQQGGGVEQLSFDHHSGAALARSQKIAAWLGGTGDLAARGSLLDIGCGNGAFLRAFGANHPGWRLTGLELDARNQALVEAIPGVVKLHAGPLDSLHSSYDMVALIHALEHIAHPVSYLQALAGKLNPGGMVLIEVPDLVASPFDILIADHCTHFSASTLCHVVSAAGYDTLHIEAGHVAKELTLLARRPAVPSGISRVEASENGHTVATRHIAWLEALLAQGRQARAPLGIFGTSISASWLAAALGDKVAFFVDEDANRAGRQHMGLPIHGPQDAPKGCELLMPLRADIATAVSARLSATQLQIVIPPWPEKI